MGWFDEALSTVLGGNSTTSNNSCSYGSIFGSIFDNNQGSPQKENKTHDEGLFGLGSSNEYQPVGSTFEAYGSTHRNEDEALQYLDDTTCYSGSLICPVCKQPKISPSALERCKSRHRREGYKC